MKSVDQNKAKVDQGISNNSNASNDFVGVEVLLRGVDGVSDRRQTVEVLHAARLGHDAQVGDGAATCDVTSVHHGATRGQHIVIGA